MGERRKCKVLFTFLATLSTVSGAKAGEKEREGEREREREGEKES